MFRWVVYCTGVLLGIALLVIANDVRFIVKTNFATVIAKTELTAQSAQAVAGDVKEVRQLLGISGNRDAGFLGYANSLFDQLSNVPDGTMIGRGASMKDAVPAAGWIVGARKEAILLVATEKSKEAILHKLSISAIRKIEFFIMIPGKDPESLESWIRREHAESSSLPAVKE